jgi:hypothetical protein
MARMSGVTTNIEERKKYWTSQYPNLWAWREYGPFSREDAQEAERRLAKMYGSKTSPEEEPPKDEKAQWHAYKFEY